MEPKDWPEDMRLALLGVLLEALGYTLPTADVIGFHAEDGAHRRTILDGCVAQMEHDVLRRPRMPNGSIRRYLEAL